MTVHLSIRAYFAICKGIEEGNSWALALDPRKHPLNETGPLYKTFKGAYAACSGRGEPDVVLSTATVTGATDIQTRSIRHVNCPQCLVLIDQANEARTVV